jgi:hypothetical protein
MRSSTSTGANRVTTPLGSTSNTGGYAVTLDGLVPDEFFRGMKVAPTPNTMDVVPFRPVEIAPGDHRFVEIEVSSGPSPYCEGNANNARLEGIDQMQFRYSYLGLFHRQVTVTPPFQLVIVCAELPKSYDAS